jgi:acetyl-CoA synthetase
MDSISALTQEQRTYPSPEGFRSQALIQDPAATHQASLTDPDRFWGDIAAELHWTRPWDQVFRQTGAHHAWFIGGQTNITLNALDRHAQGPRRNQVALFWLCENGQSQTLTYDLLLRRVCQMANALKSRGVQRGDRVIVYMPLTPEGMIAMLACARIGAIHSVVYAGMGVQALRSRIEDSQAQVVICADVTYRNGKRVGLKSIVDNALEGLESVHTVLVHRRQDPPIEFNSSREIDLESLVATQPDSCPAEIMEAEDPLFILYTSGTTGQPKGVVHVHGGYMVGVSYLMRAFYDLKPNDIFWSTSDIGWIVGHSYIVYGPLLNGGTVLAREGAIDYPHPGITWETIARYGVNVLFTAPTALRLFMRHGIEQVTPHNLSSLRLVASAGEPLNPEAQAWAQTHLLSDRGLVLDNWWQTEIASPVLGTLPAMTAKVGKVGKPLPGVEAVVLNPDGEPVGPNQGGLLVLKRPLPYMMRTIWGDDSRYLKYWEDFPGGYTSGDVAFYDEDGYFCVLGRADDVISVAGHRIGTAEVESAFLSHPAVAESAVVGLPDEIKGERIKGFVVLKAGHEASDHLANLLRDHVRRELGPIVTPSEIEFRETLPKTRSGKIVRRLLKAESLGLDPGDVSTLAD